MVAERQPVLPVGGALRLRRERRLVRVADRGHLGDPAQRLVARVHRVLGVVVAQQREEVVDHLRARAAQRGARLREGVICSHGHGRLDVERVAGAS